MAQFQVPQFIETEDKIIGPLTLKQFLYLAAAGAVSFLSFFVLNTFLWLIITAFFGIVAAALAFIKYNGRPLPMIAFSAFKYLWNPKKYLWQREEKKIEAPEIEIHKAAPIDKPKMQIRIPLKGLWLKLTTSSQSAPKQPAIKQIQKEKFEAFKRITGEKEVARRVDYR